MKSHEYVESLLIKYYFHHNRHLENLTGLSVIAEKLEQGVKGISYGMVSNTPSNKSVLERAVINKCTFETKVRNNKAEMDRIWQQEGLKIMLGKLTPRETQIIKAKFQDKKDNDEIIEELNMDINCLQLGKEIKVILENMGKVVEEKW